MIDPSGPVYLAAAGHAPGDVLPHGHEFHELVLVRGGVGAHVTDAGSRPIARGYVFALCPGQLHHYTGLETLDMVNFLYLPENLGDGVSMLPGAAGLLHHRPDLPFAILDERTMGVLEEVVMEIELEQERRNPGWEYFVRMAFLRLVGIICRAAVPAVEDPPKRNRILRLLHHLDRNYHRPAKLSELAQLCGVSESTLARGFRAATGDSLTDYLVKLRLEKGAALLRENEWSVQEVARRVGFRSSGYFSRMFRRKFKITPHEYRQSFHFPPRPVRQSFGAAD